MPSQHFVAPACVIDCSAQGAADPDYLLTVADIEAWEARHGKIPAGLGADAHRLVEADRSGGVSEFRRGGPAHAGAEPEAVSFWSSERDVLGFGSEAIGTDAGQGYHFGRRIRAITMHGAGRYGLQCLTNLDLLPPTGAVLIVPAAQDQAGQRQPVARAGAGRGPREMTARPCRRGDRRQRRHRLRKSAGRCSTPATRSSRWRAAGRRNPHAKLHAVEVDLIDGRRDRTGRRRCRLALRRHAVVHNAGVVRPALLPDVELDDLQALSQLHLGCRDRTGAGGLAGDEEKSVRPHRPDVVARRARPRDPDRLCGDQGRDGRHGADLGAGACR